MAIHYVDYKNGDSSGDGTSFTNRRSKVQGLSVSAGDTVRIMGSPDPTLVGTGKARRGWGWWMYQGTNLGTITYSTTEGDTNIYINNFGKKVFTGDTIQIIQNTDNQYINGTWEVTRVDDNNIKLNGYTAQSATTGSGGKITPANGRRLLLDTAVTKNVASNGHRTTAWTASTDVTTQLITSSNFAWNNSEAAYNEHYYSDEVHIAAGFGTGKAAYWATGTLDLSGYQQISLMLLCNLSSQHWGNNCSLRLCTDNAGATSVHTIPLDISEHNYQAWSPITVDLGTNLNSSIQSIALYVDTDQGEQKFWLSNIIACKASSSADSLTHSTVIGLNTTADPTWFGIQSINEKRIILEGRQQASSSDWGYYSPGFNVGFSNDFDGTNIYKRDCILPKELNNSNTSTTTWSDITSKSGSYNNQITFSGGWNTTDMSSQSLNATFLDLVTRRTTFSHSSCNWCNFEKLGIVRSYEWKWSHCTYLSLDHVYMSGSRMDGSVFYPYYSSLRKCIAYLAQSPVYFYQCSFYKNEAVSSPSVANEAGKNDYQLYVTQPSAYNGVTFTQKIENGYFGKIVVRGCGYTQSRGINFGSNMTVESTALYIDHFECSSYELGIYSYQKTPVTINTAILHNNAAGILYKREPGLITINSLTYTQDAAAPTKPENYYSISATCTLLYNGPAKINALSLPNRQLKNEGSEFYTQNDQVTGTYASTPMNLSSGQWYRRNANNVSGAHETVYKYGTISNNTTTRHTASGFSWDFYMSGSGGNALVGSMKTKFGKFAVKSGSQVTIGVWVYPGTSAGKGKLILDTNPTMGLTEQSAVSSSHGAWEQLTSSFTPTADGYVDVSLDAYGGGASHVYFDDMTITQA